MEQVSGASERHGHQATCGMSAGRCRNVVHAGMQVHLALTCDWIDKTRGLSSVGLDGAAMFAKATIRRKSRPPAVVLPNRDGMGSMAWKQTCWTGVLDEICPKFLK